MVGVKVAIPCDGSKVAGHFGRCEKYVLFNEESGELKSRSEIKAPAHKPGFLPKFLKGKGVQKIVCQGIGPRAVNLFNQMGIDVVAGVSGEIDSVIDKYLKGELEGSESTCDHY